MNAADYHGWGYLTGEVASHGDLSRNAPHRGPRAKARDRLISSKSVLDYSLYLTKFVTENERSEMRVGSFVDRLTAALRIARRVGQYQGANRALRKSAGEFLHDLYVAIGMGALEADGIATLETLETD